jgi:hypothetical protein
MRVTPATAKGPTVGITRDGHTLTYTSARDGVIDAPPDAVWPWLIQMGYDRGGWYAIDRLEKLLGVGRFATGGSARTVVAELQALSVGDTVPLSRTKALEVAALERPTRLLYTLQKNRVLDWTWQFVLTGEKNGATTRLTITTVMRVKHPLTVVRAGIRLAYGVFHVGHGVMERVQLRTLAKRVPHGRTAS